jgi:flagellar biosynthesis/type III secretory pathway M-ring protein FliF/YscJ
MAMVHFRLVPRRREVLLRVRRSLRAPTRVHHRQVPQQTPRRENRPRLAPPEPGTQLSEVVGDPEPPAPMSALPALAGPLHSNKLEAARAMAKQNPAAVASIVRGWVNGET